MRGTRAILAALLLSSARSLSAAQASCRIADEPLPSLSQGDRQVLRWIDPPHTTPRPDAAALAAIAQRLVVVWEEPREARAGCLALRGRLFWRADDDALRPVDWYQGLRVLIAKEPDARPDWSAFHGETDTAWADGVTLPDGSFAAGLPTWSIRRPVGATRSFQIGLCLSEHVMGAAVGHGRLPVAASTVARVRVSGPEQISRTLETINAVPSPEAYEYDPLPLVRAVNHLPALGKERALAELRRFCAAVPASPLRLAPSTRIAESIDTADVRCVFLVARLLFEPPHPPLFIGAPEPAPAAPKDWPCHPLVPVDDVPFLVVFGYSSGGIPESPLVHLDWYERHGRLRDAPLRPADDPLAAVERLLEEERARGLRRLEPELLRQAARLAARVTGDTEDELALLRGRDDPRWSELVRRHAALAGRWYPEHQTYARSARHAGR